MRFFGEVLVLLSFRCFAVLWLWRAFHPIFETVTQVGFPFHANRVPSCIAKLPNSPGGGTSFLLLESSVSPPLPVTV